MVDFCNFHKNNLRDRKKNLRDLIEIYLFFKNILGLKMTSDI